MAWTQGNRRWTIPFKSLNGTTCTINIYQRGYTGSEVTELSDATTLGQGTDEPFFYEEDNDQDLLNVIRTKTGYINLVEHEFGALSELYPATSHDHYVEFLYGSALKFTGFIRATAYENSWQAGPREISLPVVSPLGLLDTLYFQKSMDLSTRTIGQLLKEVLDGLQADTAGVYFPDPNQQANYTMFWMRLSSDVVLPATKEYHNNLYTTDQQLDAMYDAISYRDFVEGLCNCYGMMLHEVDANRIAFTKFDYDGMYSLILPAYLPTGVTRQRLSVSGGTVADLAATTEVASDDNIEAKVLPYTRITVNGEGGEFARQELAWYYCRRTQVDSSYGDWVGVLNTPFAGSHYLACDNLAEGTYIESSGLLHVSDNTKPVFFIALGDNALKPMVAFETDVAIYQAAGYRFNVLKATFNVLPYRNDCVLHYTAHFGEKIDTRNDTGHSPAAILEATFKCGNYYLDRNSQGGTFWTYKSASEAKPWIALSYGEDKKLLIPPTPQGSVMELSIDARLNAQPQRALIHTIEDLSLTPGDGDAVGDYIGTPKPYDQVVFSGSPSENEATVDCLFTNVFKTNNFLQIVGQTASVSQPTHIVQGGNTYAYMLRAQDRLEVTVKGTLPDNEYIKKLQYVPTDKRWRLIAESFYPATDDYVLTLHSSSIIQ